MYSNGTTLIIGSKSRRVRLKLHATSLVYYPVSRFLFQPLFLLDRDGT